MKPPPKKHRPAQNPRQPAPEAPGSASHSIGTKRRRWGFRLAAMTLVPLLLLTGLELGLRVAGYGYPTDFFLPLRIGNADFLVQNEDFSRRFFPGEVSRQPSALRMQARKPADTLRIFVLGESAAMGDPEPSFGPSRHLESLLRLRHPQKKFEVVNVAFTAINSHVILPIARECARHEGDLWIIYMGNNEMVGPFGAATVFGIQSPPRNYVRLMLALQRTRIGQLARALAQRWHKNAPAASWEGMQMFLENQVAPDSPKRTAAGRNFAGNLEDILATGLNSGARVVLNTMAVNLRDSPPFASTASTPDRATFEAAFARGSAALTNGAWQTAAAAFTEATRLDANHAAAHYYRAVSLDQLGDHATALKEFQLACDLDALPFRADSRINEAIRAAAARHATAALTLLDAPAALASLSGVTPCGDETFYEHVHFNFDGSYRLGLAWAQAAEHSLTNLLGHATADWASQEVSERALALTDWNRKLVIASVVQRLQQPPLSAQPNNPARVAHWQQREQQLLAGLNRETLARAREIYLTALQAQPDDHFLHEVHGNFLQLTGDLPGATREWQQTADLMPHDFLPWFQLGVLLARQNQPGAAQKHFQKALKLRPGLVEGWMELGRCLASMQQWAGALDAFEHALRLRPRDPTLHARRAQILTALNQRAEAIAAYRQAVELFPGNWEARTALGDLFAAEGQWPAATAQYEAAVQIRPDHAATRVNFGRLLARQGRSALAVAQFEKALELDPGNATAADQIRQLQPAPAPR
jgi:tetratricopeptide (TPR) repeat protein